MATGDTKADIINGAYSKLRISGITIGPSAEDTELALSVLESTMREYRGECMGYAFEDQPSSASKHGIPPMFWDPVKSILATRLMPDFGKGDSAAANQTLLQRASGAESFIFSRTASPRQTNYPSRQPIGSGSRPGFHRFRRFYGQADEAPNTCETKTLYIGDVSDFVEDFNAYLNDNESIASELIDTFTISANTGLNIVSSAKSDSETAIEYQISAVGSNEYADEVLQVKIIVTTTKSRVETRIINFHLISAVI